MPVRGRDDRLQRDVRDGRRARLRDAGSAPTLITSAPGAYWKTDGQLTEVTSGNADVTVNDGATAQTWEGFGGAFNEMGWNYLSMLGETDRDAALRLLYGADGARFAFGRIPIGATDYAMIATRWTRRADDTSLAGFSIDRDTQRLIPFVKAAQAVKANIRFWASPWTPPTWMKQAPFSAGNVVSPFDGGTMKSDDATMTAFAQYLIKFVQAYAQQGIAIETISPQNEPNYTGTYPTCGWSPATYTKFIGQHLGPAVARAGLTTKIMLGTFNGGGSDGSIIGSVMGDDAARGYIQVLGYQWGMMGSVPGARVIQPPRLAERAPVRQLPLGVAVRREPAPNDQAYAVESWRLIRDWIRSGVTAYSAWNMVLDTVGVGIDTTRVWPQNALLTVDTSTRTLNITPAYYVFRHLSRFVAQGAKVVATSGGRPGVQEPGRQRRRRAVQRRICEDDDRCRGRQKLQFAMPGSGWATVVAR